MKKITIIYYSQGGNNEKMAKAVRQGALTAGAKVSLKKVTRATVEDILNCDAVVFGSPNYFSYMAGALKELLEQAFIDLADKDVEKPYAVFSCGGSMGGKPAIASIEEICSRFGGRFGKFRFKKAAEGVAATEKPSLKTLKRCKELGRKMASLP
jgi:multimeric flavodoxin WrbA